MRYFIGIDIGASFIKAALFDIDSCRIRSIVKYPTPENGLLGKKSIFAHARFEVTAIKYVTIARQVINDIVKKINQPVEGIVMCSQMHGMVLVNEDGTACTPFIGWQDERMLENNPKTKKPWIHEYKERLRSLVTMQTGITLRSGLMGPTLYWLKENGFLNKNPHSCALFLGDYVAKALTKGKSLVHPTHACGSALFNVKTNKWDTDIISLLGISLKHLPKVVDTGGCVGNIKIMNTSVPVYVSVGDLQAAILGSFVRENSDISINIGTGSQVSLITHTFSRGNHDVRSYFDNAYLNTITFIPAGRALNVIIQFIEEIGATVFHNKKSIDIWDKLHQLIQHKKTSEGLKARVSFFSGNATGFDDGFFEHVTEKNWTLSNMFYSVLEDMAHNYLNAYKRFSLQSARHIVLSGGLARKSKKLRDLIHDKFHHPVSLSLYEEETLTGLFLLSLVCSQTKSSLKDATESMRRQRIKYTL